MSTILNALGRVEAKLRDEAARKPPEETPGEDNPSGEHPLAHSGDGAASENDRAMEVYYSLIERIGNIQNGTREAFEAERSHSRAILAEIAKTMETIPRDFAQQLSALRKELLSETGKAKAAVTQSAMDTIKQMQAEMAKSMAALNESLAVIRGDATGQRATVAEIVRQREAEAKAAKAALAALQAEIASLKQSHKETGRAIAAVTESLSATCNDSVRQDAAFTKEVRQRETETKEHRSVIATLQNEIAVLKKTQTKTEKGLAALNDALSTTRSDNDRQDDAFRKESKQRDTDTKTHAAALTALQSEIAAIKKRLDKTDKSIATASEMLSATRNDNDRQDDAFAKEVKQRNAEIKTYAAALAALQSELPPLKQGQSKTEKALVILNDNLISVRNENTRQDDAFAKESKQRDADRETAKAALVALRAEMATAKQYLAEIEKKAAALNESLLAVRNEAARQRDTLAKEIQQRNTEHGAGRGEMAALLSEIRALQQGRDEAQKTIAALKESLAVIHNELLCQRNTLKQENQQRNEEREAGKAALALAQSQIDALRVQLATPVAEQPVAPPQEPGKRETAAPAAPETATKPPMGKDEAEEMYNASIQAFYRGDFVEALRLVDEICEAFPEHANLLYNRARCLLALERKQEAREICDHLIATRQYAPAIELRSSISG